jgi:excisionase family DNA binding protein
MVGISEAARILAVHVNSLRAWSDDGRIATLWTPGGHRRFEVSEVQRFRESMRRRPADGRRKAPEPDEPAGG